MQITKGAKVDFKGTRHYPASTGGKACVCSPCEAEVTNVAPGKAFPYHVVGSKVHGWVAASDVLARQIGTIICDSLHIRQKPDKASVSLGIMKKGDTFTVTGAAVNGWYPII